MDQLILRAQENDGYVVIETAPFRVGRSADSDLRIRHAGVSSLHAEFRYEDRVWRLVDRGSTNGTFVNGIRIADPVALRPGDLVHFGLIGFQVVTHVEDDPYDAPSRTVPDASGRVRSVLELFRVVHEDRCWPAFQPIVDLATRKAVGFEALGRTASRNTGGPSILFKLAEESQAAAALSGAFRKTARQCASCRHCWPENERHWLFLNLHPAEILVPTFPQLLDDLARSVLQRWYQIVVELPESLVCNARELVVWVEQIRRRGLLVAYDDFGRGQSRIPDLLHAPPDFLKLDRELVAGLGTGTVKDDLVKAIVDASNRLGVKTIAEGIERFEELNACADLGIQYGQGYALGRPKPAWEIFATDPETLPEDCPFVRLKLLPEDSPIPLPIPD